MLIPCAVFVHQIAVDNDRAEALAKKLLEHEDVKPAALGPRDTLRLEAGTARRLGFMFCKSK